MSKAFTRESDDAPDLPVRRRPSSPLPPGVKNYLTAGGAKKLREELDALINIERPRLAALSDDDARRELGTIDDRIEHLQQSLRGAVIVPPPAANEDRVRFGATVTVRNQSGEESRYRIVGVDEADVDRDWISWLSPLGKALLNARIGERIRIKLPSGDEQLEVVSASYE